MLKALQIKCRNFLFKSYIYILYIYIIYIYYIYSILIFYTLFRTRAALQPFQPTSCATLHPVRFVNRFFPRSPHIPIVRAQKSGGSYPRADSVPPPPNRPRSPFPCAPVPLPPLAPRSPAPPSRRRRSRRLRSPSPSPTPPILRPHPVARGDLPTVAAAVMLASS
jgi:hypothetical protein